MEEKSRHEISIIIIGKSSVKKDEEEEGHRLGMKLNNLIIFPTLLEAPSRDAAQGSSRWRFPNRGDTNRPHMSVESDAKVTVGL